MIKAAAVIVDDFFFVFFFSFLAAEQGRHLDRTWAKLAKFISGPYAWSRQIAIEKKTTIKPLWKSHMMNDLQFTISNRKNYMTKDNMYCFWMKWKQSKMYRQRVDFLQFGVFGKQTQKERCVTGGWYCSADQLELRSIITRNQPERFLSWARQKLYHFWNR